MLLLENPTSYMHQKHRQPIAITLFDTTNMGQVHFFVHEDFTRGALKCETNATKKYFLAL